MSIQWNLEWHHPQILWWQWGYSNQNPSFNARTIFDFGTNHKTKHVVFELHFDSNPKYIRWRHIICRIYFSSLNRQNVSWPFDIKSTWVLCDFSSQIWSQWLSQVCSILYVPYSIIQRLMTFDHFRGTYADIA